MGPQMSSAPPTLWVLGCLALVLWLWVLCTTCHRYVHSLGSTWSLAQLCGQRGQGSRQALLGPEAEAPAPISAFLASPPSCPQEAGTEAAVRAAGQRDAVTATAEATAPLLPQQVGHQIA